ncbi:hypothetical protein XENTR_v10022717 [Xenopus tropicalis]|uniref:Toll-like receptor 2 n=1 Tax=Xenopus tropicalis TaxID=8364 RepID=F6PY92_XENTR|nr:toll-like receptor 2 [Xenopus tropicalis]KAE8588736.1 hypothetical protein XENTR_v10022717 [Xenopus tropicalis]|eukprot:XP_002943096.1 PREDICTED: toll-like receptor 2 [Xenopus tropicalis]
MNPVLQNGQLGLWCVLVLGLVRELWCQTPCLVDESRRFVSCSGRNLVEIPKNFSVTLEELDMSFNRIFQIKSDDFSAYTNLRALNLSYNQIATIENGSFNSNTQLRSLTLFNNSLTEMPSALLEPLHLLEFLDMSNNFYNKSTLGDVFQTLVNLQTLSIGGPLVSKVQKDDFVPIRNIGLQKFALKTMSSLTLYEEGAFSVLNTHVLWFDIALDTNPQALLLILKDLKGKSFDVLRFRNLFEITYYTDTVDIFSWLPSISTRELVFYRGKFNENLLWIMLENIQRSSILDLSLLSVDFSRSHSANKTNVSIDDLRLRTLRVKDVTNPDILRFDWTFTWFRKISNLYIINVNFNSVPCDAWSEMSNLEKLDMSTDELVDTYLYNPWCQDVALPTTDTFILAYNNLQSLRMLSLLTAKWPKLATLDLRSNSLGSNDEMCTWTPSIRTVILKDNMLKVGVFQCLPTTVEFLDLSHSQLEQLDMDYFNKATNLKQLILSHNKIKFISSEWKSPNLQVLALEDNSFGVINVGSFKDLPKLRNLTAGDNPYGCTCDLYRFFSQIREEGRIVLADWPQAYKCYSPPDLLDTKVEFYNPGKVQCDVRLVVAISVSTTAVVVILSMLLCWRFDVLWYVQTMFAIVQSKYRSRNMGNTKEYLYHAFISYSHSDADWVRGELLHQLESCSPPYRVCIHERDFLPGRWIIDNIIENIENSRKIIFVLSRNFVNSEWCNYELYFAHQRAVGHALEDVILVVKEKVTMEDLPKRFQKLRKLLRTKTYLEWPLEHTRQHFFWIQLRSILGKVSSPVIGQDDLLVDNGAAASWDGPASEAHHEDEIYETLIPQ